MGKIHDDEDWHDETPEESGEERTVALPGVNYVGTCKHCHLTVVHNRKFGKKIDPYEDSLELDEDDMQELIAAGTPEVGCRCPKCKKSFQAQNVYMSHCKWVLKYVKH